MAIEMAEGVVPRLNLEPIKALFVIAHEPPPELQEPDEWSEEFHNFLDCCLRKNPKERKTASELLEHPFIAKSIELDSFLIDLVKEAKNHKRKAKKTLSQIMREIEEEEEGDEDYEGGGGGYEDEEDLV
jgi:serine/threonine protein kinase